MSSSVLRFDGAIAGLGSTSGVRVVVGMWVASPFGPFTDFMVERADGHRVLIAPSAELADFLVATYVFDEVRIEPTSQVRAGRRIEAVGTSVTVRLSIGRRAVIGALLRLVPAPLARARWWVRALDPIARRLLRGVRTVGTAGGGRREYYAARDVHRLDSASGVVDGQPLGAVRPVDPPVRFGFGSTPREPSLTHLTTLISGVEVGAARRSERPRSRLLQRERKA